MLPELLAMQSALSSLQRMKAWYCCTGDPLLAEWEVTEWGPEKATLRPLGWSMLWSENAADTQAHGLCNSRSRWQSLRKPIFPLQQGRVCSASHHTLQIPLTAQEPGS